MITLKCKINPEDYIKAQYLHMRPSPWLKYLGIALLSFCVVLVAALAFSSIAIEQIASAFAPLLILGLLYALMLFLIIPWNVRRVFEQQKTLQSEYETIISPEMIETTSEHGTMRMRLSDFYKYKVSKDLILLYQSQALFHMFPRRFFASEEDFHTFLSYLEANLGKPKR